MYASETLLFIAFCSYNVAFSSAQCLSTNETDIKETTVGSTVQKLIDGNLDFSLNLLKTLETQERNNQDNEGIFFSPFSIWSALMVAYMGAQGSTESQLRSVLGAGDANKETVWSAYRNLLSWNAYRQASPKQESYTTANKVYFQEGTPIRDCLREMISSEIDFADFVGDAETARSKINQWIDKETQSRIQELVPPGGVNAMTKIVIANAVYFKERWQTQFDPANTQAKKFTLPSGSDILVNMMSVKGNFLYGSCKELQCTGLELPYNGNNMSMLILLPNNRNYGVSYLAERLTSEKLQNFISEMFSQEVSVFLPKFKLEDNFELRQVLIKMGLLNLFDPTLVDLSGFTGAKDMFVDEVYHRSFVDVNEEGTEAAGATSALMSRKKIESFVADHPFIFLIRDNVANVVLFMGAVQKPSEYNKSL